MLKVTTIKQKGYTMAQKTKAQNKSSFFSKLVPRTRKSQLIVFLLTFALIGGGIMAYRSFAASGSGAYTGNQLGNMSSGGSYQTTETVGSKRGYPVWEIQNINGVVGIAPAYQPYIWVPNARVQACATVSNRSNRDAVVIVTIRNARVASWSKSHQFTLGRGPNTGYERLCSGQMNHTSGNDKLTGHVSVKSGSGLPVRVGGITIEYTNN